MPRKRLSLQPVALLGGGETVKSWVLVEGLLVIGDMYFKGIVNSDILLIFFFAFAMH
jgi:hypothetical protein